MLTQEQIERMPDDANYWELSDREAEIRAQMELQVLTPRHRLPYFSITDYEKARKGELVPMEQPKPVPLGFWQSVDNRIMSEYLRDVEPSLPPSPPAPRLGEVPLISDYMARLGETTIPMYLRGVGSP